MSSSLSQLSCAPDWVCVLAIFGIDHAWLDPTNLSYCSVHAALTGLQTPWISTDAAEVHGSDRRILNVITDRGPGRKPQGLGVNPNLKAMHLIS